MPAPQRSPARPSVDTLVCRLAGALALLAAAVFLVSTFALTRLPLVAGPDGVAAYAIPGIRHAIDPAAVAVLGGLGLVAATIGLLALLVGHVPRSGIAGTVASRRSAWRPSIKRQPLVLLLGAAALAAVLWLKR